MSKIIFSCDDCINGPKTWGHCLTCMISDILWCHSYNGPSQDALYCGGWVYHESYGVRLMFKIEFITMSDRMTYHYSWEALTWNL